METHVKTFWSFLLYFTLFILFNSLIFHRPTASADESSYQLLNERVSNIELKNGEQNKISREDRKEINQLRGRVAQLEDLVANIINLPKNDVSNNEAINKDQMKRPARLLPLQILLGKPSNKTNKEEEIERYYGPATNCADLSKLGYTLNGYYLVNSGINQPNADRKITVIDCRFRQPTGMVSETFIGYVQLKSKSVHFYVQRNKTFEKSNGIVPFELERLNEGSAMHLSSGVFTVPVEGIYHFQFVGKKSQNSGPLNVHLQLNGVNVASTYGANMQVSFNVPLSASLSLKKGDKVNIYKENGVLEDAWGHHTQFSGWLVEESLNLGLN